MRLRHRHETCRIMCASLSRPRRHFTYKTHRSGILKGKLNFYAYLKHRPRHKHSIGLYFPLSFGSFVGAISKRREPSRLRIDFRFLSQQAKRLDHRLRSSAKVKRAKKTFFFRSKKKCTSSLHFEQQHRVAKTRRRRQRMKEKEEGKSMLKYSRFGIQVKAFKSSGAAPRRQISKVLREESDFVVMFMGENERNVTEARDSLATLSLYRPTHHPASKPAMGKSTA